MHLKCQVGKIGFDVSRAKKFTKISTRAVITTGTTAVPSDC